jgi:hypothetical protein
MEPESFSFQIQAFWKHFPKTCVFTFNILQNSFSNLTPFILAQAQFCRCDDDDENKYRKREMKNFRLNNTVLFSSSPLLLLLQLLTSFSLLLLLSLMLDDRNILSR